MLVIEDLHASLGGRGVLRGVGLKASVGQILAICGPNGAGKSTLLRAALGEIRATGRVFLNGLDVTTARPDRMARIRAVLPQDTQVAFAFSVAEIVAMGQEAGDFAGCAGLVGRALSAVGLSGYGARDFQTLSGGERQRVHLARALAQVWEASGADGPRWLFLDEPVASLDLGHQLQVMSLARDFANRGGGVVTVMHDLNLSAMFADRLAFLMEGRIIADGAPGEVLTADMLGRAYRCEVAMNTAPLSGPWFVPQSCRLPEGPPGAGRASSVPQSGCRGPFREDRAVT